MATFNQVILLGNLTRDVEIRTTPKGTSICQFGLAVNRPFKGSDGQTKDETMFLDVEAWGKLAESLSKYLKKGSHVLLQGRLKQDTWEDKESGQKRSKIKVVAENVQFIGSKSGQEEQGTNRPSSQQRPQQTQDDMTDVPF